jgi:hypothetical protein
MIAPIPPPRPDSWQPLRASGRERRCAPEDDDALVRRLDANELYDIHQGLDWCEREMRALGLLRLGQRRHVAALRRRWAHRWRAATGRPAVSLQVLRAWQLAAIVGLGATLLAVLSGPDQHAALAPAPSLVAPAPEVAVIPAPTPIPVPVPSPAAEVPIDPNTTGQPAGNVTDQVAKSRARRLARRLQQCRRVNLTFLGCADVIASHIGSDVTIRELTEDRFTLTAAASSGNVFTIVGGADRVTVRTCATADVRGCPRNGRW